MKDIKSDLSQRKLKYAKELLEKGDDAGLKIILEVADEDPGALDPVLLATVPLWRAVVKHLKVKRSDDPLEKMWDDDRFGAAA